MSTLQNQSCLSGCRKPEQHCAGLACLPPEMLTYIFLYIDVDTIVKLGLSCPELRLPTLYLELWQEKIEHTNISHIDGVFHIWGLVGYDKVSSVVKMLLFNKFCSLLSDIQIGLGTYLKGITKCDSESNIVTFDLSVIEDIWNIANKLGILIELNKITQSIGSNPLLPHEVYQLSECLMQQQDVQFDVNLQTIDLCSTASVKAFAEILKKTKNLQIAKMIIRDHEVSALSEYVPRIALINELKIVITGPYLEDLTILLSLSSISRKCFWLIMGTTYTSQNDFLVEGVDDDDEEEKKLRGGALCSHTARIDNWKKTIKFITKLLNIPKCATALFAATSDG